MKVDDDDGAADGSVLNPLHDRPNRNPDLPPLRTQIDRNDANQRLRALLRVHGVRHGPPAKARGLLRLLLVRVCEVPVTAVTRLLYIQSSMRTSVLRSLAIIVLSLHVLPLGLPFFCDTDRRCDGQMPMSMPSGPTIDQTSNATDCVGSLFCAVTGTAALVLGTPLSVAANDSYVVAFDVSTFAPVDPQPPPPPPPQA